MSEYTAPIADMVFALRHIADAEGVCSLEAFEDMDAADLEAVLAEAGRFVSEVVAPTNRTGDQQGSVRNEDGSVSTPQGFKEAYRSYQQAGWGAAPFSAEWGGGNQPWVIGGAVSEMLTSANMAFSLCPMLTQGAIHLLSSHGDAEQQARWLPKLISGEWAGTMNLTEPQAGSDVGALATRAEPQPDGTYRLFGQKIFITWGEHDLTDNIVHLVLARTPDAAPGTRGISCFIAPKYLVNPDGSLGERNDISCVSIEHKLGIHASPTCVLQYGENDGAVAEIIGEEQQGMAYMFTMMNYARLGVGMEGVAIGESAWQQASAFANERRQGRRMRRDRADEKDSADDTAKPSGETGDAGKDGATSSPAHPSAQAPIVEHPDVKRMLLTMKAVTEAMRCLVYYNGAAIDRAVHSPDPEEAAKAQELVDLLTPLSKAWCTDWGNEIASLNIQVHGGMGYVEETGAAQLYRDIRIAAIYEGTNGIQALDLVGRKLPMRGGQAIMDLLGSISEVEDDLTQDLTGELADSLPGDLASDSSGGSAGDLTSDLSVLWPPIADALDAARRATLWMAEHPNDAALAGATPYLRMLATLVAGWLMARSAVAARSELAEVLADNSASGNSAEWLRAKMLTAEFFCTQILPQATALEASVTGGDRVLEAVTLV